MKRIELSMKEFITVVLRRWLPILLGAIVFAAAYSFLSYQVQERSAKRQQAEYKKDLAEYELKQAKVQTRVDTLTKRNESIEDYLSNSIMMTVNPSDRALATINISIDTQGNVEALNRVASHYMLLAANIPLIKVLEEIVPEDQNEAYLREAIDIKTTDASIVSISAVGTSNVDPERVVQAVYDYLAAQKEVVASSAGAHTLSILNQGLVRGADSSIADRRTKQENALTASKKLLKEITIEEPKLSLEKTGWTKRITVGLVAGFFLAVLAILALYILRLPIQYPEQLQRQLSVRYLGRFLNNKSGSSAPRRTPFGRKSKTSEKDALDLIAANLTEVIGVNKTILITGRLSEETLAETTNLFKAALGPESPAFLSGTKVNTNADTVRKLADADAVVLVERLYNSKLREINRDIERVTLSGKEVLGYVLL